MNLSYQIWFVFIFVYQKSLKGTFKPVFEYKINFWICVLSFWIHKGYFVVKKLVWNLRIKAFWYIKYIKTLLPDKYFYWREVEYFSGMVHSLKYLEQSIYNLILFTMTDTSNQKSCNHSIDNVLLQLETGLLKQTLLYVLHRIT